MSTDTSQLPEPAAKRAMRWEASAASEVTISGALAGDAREPAREPLGVLLVDGDHEATGLGMAAPAQGGELGMGVPEDVVDPVAVGLQRRAQAARGLGGGENDREVGLAAPPVAHPLHVAAVGVEGHGAADAVEQRLGVAIGVVGARDAVVVVVHPRDRRAVGAERRAGEEQAEPGAFEGGHGRSVPMRRARPCGAARRRSATSACHGSRGRAFGALPPRWRTSLRCRGGRAAPARRRSGGWARGPCRSEQRRAPTGGRCAWSAPRRPRARPAPRQASGAPRAARTSSCPPRGWPRRGTSRPRRRRRSRRPPAARRAAGGRRARRAATGRAGWRMR